MASEKESFVFYRSFFEALQHLKDKERLKVYDAICDLALNENDTELTGIAKIVFTLIRPQILSNTKKYKDGQKGAEYGRLGGRPRKEKTPVGLSQETPNVNENANVNDNVNDNVNELEEKIHFAEAEYVTMTNAEYEKLVSTYGKVFADQCITELDNYKGSKGKKYKSDYRAILSWVVDKLKEKGLKPNPAENSEEKKELCFDSSDLTQEQYVLYIQGKLSKDDLRKILEE